MATEKQLVTELREELRKAREAAQLFKEATEAEKQAAYVLGMEETQARLREEFSTVVRTTATFLGVRPLMLLGSLLTLA